MSIRDNIQQQVTQALKARDQKKLDALRFLFSQIKNKEIDLKHPLADEDAIKLLTTEAKHRRESIEAYEKAGRADLAGKEKFELSIIEEYLPKQLSDEELESVVSQMKATSPGADFGALMRETMKQIAGHADGGRVAAILKRP